VSFEETLVSVWRQSLVDGVENVTLDLDGATVRGLEQNPQTSSHWADLARKGHIVMQFLSEGRYIGNVVDGKVTLYARKAA
jgi:hypothetical protein